MANELNNDKVICELLQCKEEKRTHLEEEHYKLNEESQYWFDEQLVITGEINELDEDFVKSAQETEVLEQMLKAKQAEAKRLIAAIKKCLKCSKTVGVNYDTSEFTNNLKDFIRDMDKIEKNYERIKVESDIDQHEMELKMVAKNLETASEYYKKLLSENTPDESLQLDEVFEFLEKQAVVKESLEKKLVDLNKKLSK